MKVTVLKCGTMPIHLESFTTLCLSREVAVELADCLSRPTIKDLEVCYLLDQQASKCLTVGRFAGDDKQTYYVIKTQVPLLQPKPVIFEVMTHREATRLGKRLKEAIKKVPNGKAPQYCEYPGKIV